MDYRTSMEYIRYCFIRNDIKSALDTYLELNESEEKENAFKNLKNLLFYNPLFIDEKFFEGCTMLHYSIIHNKRELTAHLLTLGADVTIENENALSPYFLAKVKHIISLNDPHLYRGDNRKIIADISDLLDEKISMSEYRNFANEFSNFLEAEGSCLNTEITNQYIENLSGKILVELEPEYDVQELDFTNYTEYLPAQALTGPGYATQELNIANNNYNPSNYNNSNYNHGNHSYDYNLVNLVNNLVENYMKNKQVVKEPETRDWVFVDNSDPTNIRKQEKKWEDVSSKFNRR